jgi:hypothetical protein
MTNEATMEENNSGEEDPAAIDGEPTRSMSIWNSVKGVASKAGHASKLAAQKTKLRADMVLIDRDMKKRKMKFGMTMYDYVSPLSQNADFYAASDPLTEMLRPSLILAQKEIKALACKRTKLKEAQAAAGVKRAEAFPTKAETWSESFKNAGKSSVMHGSETKLKTELAALDRKINSIKQEFGVNLFDTFVEAEDTKGFLPTDRHVRTIYDQARGEIQTLEAEKDSKMKAWEALVGTPFEKESLDSASQSSLPDNLNTNDDSPTAGGDLHLQHQGGGVSDKKAAGTQGQFLGGFNKLKVGGVGATNNPPGKQGRFQGYFKGGLQEKKPKSLSSGC